MSATASTPLMQQLVCSPCCLPSWSFDELLPAYRSLGFTRMEAFTEWAQGRLDWHEDPAVALNKLQTAGMEITSFHLPLIHENNIEGGLKDALAAARYAEALGAKVLLFKAANREIFKRIGVRFLDALDNEQIQALPAVQNHKGSAISTVEDYREVFDFLNDDPRLKAVLEVGHFQRVNVPWQVGWEYLGQSIALIHVNDIRDGKSVHYGTGEVDFAGLMRQIKTTNYRGEIVVELELENRASNPQETLHGLQKAISLLSELYDKA
ncbi:MAG TPA: TIM barrel protein [Abditibacteriaceae bacterium]